MGYSKNVVVYPAFMVEIAETVVERGTDFRMEMETEGQAKGWRSRWYAFTNAAGMALAGRNPIAPPEELLARLRPLAAVLGQLGCWSEGKWVRVGLKSATEEGARVAAALAVMGGRANTAEAAEARMRAKFAQGLGAPLAEAKPQPQSDAPLDPLAEEIKRRYGFVPRAGRDRLSEL